MAVTFTVDRPARCESCEAVPPARNSAFGWVCSRCYGYLIAGREVPPISAPPVPRPAPTSPPESPCPAVAPSRPTAPSAASSPVVAAPTTPPAPPPTTARPAARAWGRGAGATRTASAPRGEQPVTLATVTVPPPEEQSGPSNSDRVLALLRAEPTLTDKEVADRAGLSRGTVVRIKAAARDAGDLPPRRRSTKRKLRLVRRRATEQVVEIARADPDKTSLQIAEQIGSSAQYVGHLLTKARADGRLPPAPPRIMDQVLELLQAEPTLKPADISARLGICSDNARGAIHRLRDRGLIPPVDRAATLSARVVAVAEAEPGISIRAIASRLGRTYTAISHILVYLRKLGRIRRPDPHRPGVWAASTPIRTEATMPAPPVTDPDINTDLPLISIPDATPVGMVVQAVKSKFDLIAALSDNIGLRLDPEGTTLDHVGVIRRWHENLIADQRAAALGPILAALGLDDATPEEAADAIRDLEKRRAEAVRGRSAALSKVQQMEAAASQARKCISTLEDEVRTLANKLDAARAAPVLTEEEIDLRLAALRDLDETRRRLVELRWEQTSPAHSSPGPIERCEREVLIAFHEARIPGLVKAATIGGGR